MMVPIVLATALAAFPNWEKPACNRIRSNSDPKSEEATQCYSPYHRMHFGARHTEGNGVGYLDGYTTLEGFGIYDENESFMPFLDLRAHVFNNGKMAGNVGLGSRSVIPQINHMLGAYLYYDVRQESRGLSVVNQISPGLELLGKRFEYRVNGYFPVGKRHGHKYGHDFGKFSGNNILLSYKQKHALRGGDGEAGLHLTQSTKFDLYAGAGPYYFGGGKAHGWGGKVRLLARYKEYISLEGSYSYDRVFRNIFQGTIGFNYAFGKKLTRKDRNCPQQNDLMLSRASFAPYRFEIPVVKKVKKHAKAINPATGLPWQVWFVNNTSHSAGTFASPFPTLVQAEAASAPNDMIYVFPGDGTTTGMNAGITLQDGQTLFGSGMAHKIQTTRGNMIIPAFSSTAPTLTSLANVVTLGNGNEVAGMNINLVAHTGGGNPGAIVSPTNGSNGANIHDNIITGSISYAGIIITGSGNIIIDNNQLSGPLTSTGQGIRLTTQTGTFDMDATISNNQVSGFENGIGMNYASNSSANCDILNNTLSNLNIGSQTAIFHEVSFVTFANGTGSVIGNQININNSASLINGIVVGTDTITGSASTLQINVANNNIILGGFAGSNGIVAQSSTNGTACANMVNNQISSSNPSGIFGLSFTTTGTGVVNIYDSGNTAPSVNVSGNVNFVGPDFCSP